MLQSAEAFLLLLNISTYVQLLMVSNLLFGTMILLMISHLHYISYDITLELCYCIWHHT